ncbi:MAG: hypothetical protein ACYTAO_03235 [Planctomycetota bacterium]
MKRCKLCGRVGPESTFEGNRCGWCEKIRADVMVSLQRELGV